MANGVPAVATKLGCIPGDLADKGGQTVDDFASDAPAAISTIASRLDYHSSRARQRFVELLGEYEVSIAALLRTLTSSGHRD